MHGPRFSSGSEFKFFRVFRRVLIVFRSNRATACFGRRPVVSDLGRRCGPRSARSYQLPCSSKGRKALQTKSQSVWKAPRANSLSCYRRSGTCNSSLLKLMPTSSGSLPRAPLLPRACAPSHCRRQQQLRPGLQSIVDRGQRRHGRQGRPHHSHAKLLVGPEDQQLVRQYVRS